MIESDSLDCITLDSADIQTIERFENNYYDYKNNVLSQNGGEKILLLIFEYILTLLNNIDIPAFVDTINPNAAKEYFNNKAAAKQEAAKQEAAKQEAAKQAATKQEAAKQEVAKQEAAKQATLTETKTGTEQSSTKTQSWSTSFKNLFKRKQDVQTVPLQKSFWTTSLNPNPNGGNTKKLKKNIVRIYNCYILSQNQFGGADNKLSFIIKKRLDKKIRELKNLEGGANNNELLIKYFIDKLEIKEYTFENEMDLNIVIIDYIKEKHILEYFKSINIINKSIEIDYIINFFKNNESGKLYIYNIKKCIIEYYFKFLMKKINIDINNLILINKSLPDPYYYDTLYIKLKYNIINLLENKHYYKDKNNIKDNNIIIFGLIFILKYTFKHFLSGFFENFTQNTLNALVLNPLSGFNVVTKEVTYINTIIQQINFDNEYNDFVLSNISIKKIISDKTFKTTEFKEIINKILVNKIIN